MRIAPLAPRPSRPVTTIISPVPRSVPARDDWAALYPEIERLYVDERRKLRYVMNFMEKEHGFKASEQMYKKRFAKWGFQKNSRRSAVAEPSRTRMCEFRRTINGRHTPPDLLGSMPASPRMENDEKMMLTFLTSVRTCSLAFFESVYSRHDLEASLQPQFPMDQSWLERSREVSFTFKLAIELFDRGHGKIAGRTARKAFLLVEDMLTLEGPALLWNLLEMMHHMVMLDQIQLFQMLLAHLIALVDVRMPKNSPVPTMMRSLHGTVASLTNAVHVTRDSSPTPSSPLSSSSSLTPLSSMGGDGELSIHGSRPLSYAISALLRQALVLNADILFDHFDPRLYQLYFCIHWESCSIDPPAAMFSATAQWLNHIDAQESSQAVALSPNSQDLLKALPIEEERIHQLLLTQQMHASPPKDYEMLRASSIAALQKNGNSVLSTGTGSTKDTSKILRTLTALVKAKFLAKLPATLEHPDKDSDIATEVTYLHHAEMLACVISTTIDHNDHESDGDELETSWDTVERLRYIVALRQYARGEASPQLIQAFWLLKEALIAVGKYEEAQEVEQIALCRLEKYVQEIPVDQT